MGSLVHEISYRCSDDCVMSGCPGHKATLMYFSVTDHYHFNIGGATHEFEHGELQALLRLIHATDNYTGAGGSFGVTRLAAAAERFMAATYPPAHDEPVSREEQDEFAAAWRDLHIALATTRENLK